VVASPSCWSDSRSSCSAEGWRWGNRGMAVRSAPALAVGLAALLAWGVGGCGGDGCGGDGHGESSGREGVSGEKGVGMGLAVPGRIDESTPACSCKPHGKEAPGIR